MIELLVLGTVIVLLAGLSTQDWFWTWFRKALNARGDEKRKTLQGRLYYYWADGKMKKSSFILLAAGSIIVLLSRLL